MENNWKLSYYQIHMRHVMRQSGLCYMWTTNTQISLCIVRCLDSKIPVRYTKNFKTLASNICSRHTWWQNPKDRFSRDMAHILAVSLNLSPIKFWGIKNQQWFKRMFTTEWTILMCMLKKGIVYDWIITSYQISRYFNQLEEVPQFDKFIKMTVKEKATDLLINT